MKHCVEFIRNNVLGHWLTDVHNPSHLGQKEHSSWLLCPNQFLWEQWLCSPTLKLQCFKNGDFRNGLWPSDLLFYFWIMAQTEYITTFHFERNKGRTMNTNNLKSVSQYSISNKKNTLRTTKFRYSSSDFLMSHYICRTLKGDNNSHRIWYLH